MSIGPTHQKTSPLTWSKSWFKSSHRTWPEQAVGAAIFLLVSLAFEWLLGWLIQRVEGTSLHYSRLAWTLYHALFATAMWSLWRRYSLTHLKLELTLFLCQMGIGAGWAALFAFYEPLFALAALLFLCTNTVLTALLYWKKDRFSGQVLIPPLLWIFYLTGVNMAICISNP